MASLAPKHGHRRAISDIGTMHPVHPVSRSHSRDPSSSPYQSVREPPSPYHSSHSHSRDPSPYSTRAPSPYSVRVPAPAPAGRVRTTSFPATAPPMPRPGIPMPSPGLAKRTLIPSHEFDYGYDSDFLTAPPAPEPHSHSHSHSRSRPRSHSQSRPSGLPGSAPSVSHFPVHRAATYVATAPRPPDLSPRGRKVSLEHTKRPSPTHPVSVPRTLAHPPSAPGSIHIPDYAAHQAQSARPYQEDGYVLGPPARYTSSASATAAPVTAFFGVYDGHGGAFSSTHAARALHGHLLRARGFEKGGRAGYESALREAFAREDAKLRGHQRAFGCGSTAVVALVDLDHAQLYVANAGDSRAVLATRDGSGRMRALRISEDHNPTGAAERARIEAAGGFITSDGRVGNLAVSRSLGDHRYKLTPGAPASAAPPEFMAALRPGVLPLTDLVSGSPHIASISLSGASTPFLVMGSDGLFNALSDQSVVDMVAELLASRWPAQAIAQHLVDAAVGKSRRGKGDGDNVTAVVVVFA